MTQRDDDGSTQSSEVAKMRSMNPKALIPIAVLVGVGVLVFIVRSFFVAVDPQPERTTGASPGGDTPGDAPPPAALFAANDFPALVTGPFSLRSKVDFENKSALLYRGEPKRLVLCVVEPDAADSVRCDEMSLPLMVQTTQLVEHATDILIYGVETMGETPEETVYAAFLPDGTRYEGDLTELKLASDRPKLPDPTPTWLDAKLGGVATKLERTPAGLLQLTRGDDEPVVVCLDEARGGPSTGTRIAVIGQHAAAVIFQSQRGLFALQVDTTSVKPIRP